MSLASAIVGGAHDSRGARRVGARPGAGPDRPVLRLVPPLPPEGDAPAPAARRPIRLTRRGRAVCTVLILALVAAVSVLLAPPTQAAPPAARPRAIVVHPGDTLWSIATAALPDESPVDAMVAIERLNHMPDATVYVGQQILLPPA